MMISSLLLDPHYKEEWLPLMTGEGSQSRLINIAACATHACGMHHII